MHKWKGCIYEEESNRALCLHGMLLRAIGGLGHVIQTKLHPPVAYCVCLILLTKEN